MDYRASWDSATPAITHEVVAYYEHGGEAPRLLNGTGLLEFARTQEIVLRHLPEPPAVIYDVGGGPGLYACWLARLGYGVHLVDVTPLHVEQALAASSRQPAHPLVSAAVGDARQLSFDSASADAVLL
ncbi:MAG: class I SAM-dependent methyltransferase, partial [Anaerolineae bacterium]|nr:class I SAM-dependent methyltransferase [Anaerolineae bacterium]